MADLEIVSKKENVLLKRTEVHFRVTHLKEKTPQRASLRDKIAAAAGGKPGAVVIEWMRTRYGAPLTTGYAKLYDSAETAKKTEPHHILVRNGLAEKKAKAAAAPAAKAEAKPPEKKK